jgi:NAD+ kinase
MAGEEELLVGVVGTDTSEAVTALTAAGVRTRVDSPRAVLAADPDVIAAVGESGLLSLARQHPETPVLPVDAGAGVRSIPTARVEEATSRLHTEEWTTERHPLLAVDIGDTREYALFDAMAVTAEPAHISEFTVATGDERVARFRADGVVVATPAGTCGYARDAGGPVVPPGSAVLAIVPVSPFATTLDHWVVPNDAVSITVEREDATVDALADDRTIGAADVGEAIRLSADGALDVLRVPEGRSPFDSRGAELEKL